MFSGGTNDGYYQLGLVSVDIIRDAIMFSRGIVENSSPRSSTRSRTKEHQATSTNLIDL